jgi:cbb3-type cytochrome oxidase maturation protein
MGARRRHPPSAGSHDGADPDVALTDMDSLYLLVPMSVLLVLALMALFAWALQSSQFDDLEREGERILEPDAATFDKDQTSP